MKTLDRYILRNFLISVLMCTLVTLALRIVSDLFVNMDEFSELSGKLGIGWIKVAGYVFSYYAHRSMVYFQEMGGVILLMAALFSLARMNHTNELVAAMAGGMSLYRLVAPIIAVGMGFALIGAVNQELLIPRAKDRLALSRDEAPGYKALRVELIPDAERNVWYSKNFDQHTGMMIRPLVLARDARGRQQAKIAADAAIQDHDRGGWRMLNASMAVLSSVRTRGGLDSTFVLTPRAPEALGGPEGLYSQVDGLKVAYSRLAVGGVLIDPAFGIYAPPSGEKKVRQMGVLRASLAVYEDRGRDSGYRLVGRPDLTLDSIPDWRAFCSKLLAGQSQGYDQPLGRLWSRFDGELREQLRRAGEHEAKVSPSVKRRLLAAVNAAIAEDVLVGVESDSPVAGAGRLAASVAKVLKSEVIAPQFRVAVINRAALDAAMKAEVIRAGGELLLLSSLTGEQIVLRQSGKWMDYMSSRELAAMIRTNSAPDPAAASLAMHMRVTTPVSWVIMLLLGIPFVVSRERRLKSSTLLCLLLVGGFHASIFISRYLGDDLFELLGRSLRPYGVPTPSPAWGPIIGAWLPVVVFVPVAVLLLDSMHSMHVHDRNDTLTDLLVSPGGRIRRRLFWRWTPILLGVVALGALVDLAWVRQPALVCSLTALAALWPLLMLHFKRSHDRNRSGLFVLAPLIPLLVLGLIRGSVADVFELNAIGWIFLFLFAGVFVSLLAWVLVECWLLPGDPGPNAFGHDPKDISVSEEMA